ncbi:MAG: hypothetical protein KDE53_27815, partial [Caldilineaceae bacterium]|nr:hypothetical protein [Caldilineaceae bacterium]
LADYAIFLGRLFEIEHLTLVILAGAERRRVHDSASEYECPSPSEYGSNAPARKQPSIVYSIEHVTDCQ